MSNDYNIHLECLNNEWHSDPANSDAGVMTMAAQSVSVAIAGTRWRRVFELLRGNFVRKRISRSQGIQAHKKQTLVNIVLNQTIHMVFFIAACCTLIFLLFPGGMYVVWLFIFFSFVNKYSKSKFVLNV